MAKKKTNLKSGAAFVWFFSTDIKRFRNPASPDNHTLAEPVVDASTDNGGSADEVVDNNSINTPDITGEREEVSGGKKLVTEIRPEQQLSEASLSLERDNFEINSQVSSYPTEYTQTGIDGTLTLSIADITLRNLALAFGYEDQVKSQDLGQLTEAQRLHLTDNAGAYLRKFPLLIIPAPTRWTASTDDQIQWRNSWVFIPQASVVNAQPNLVFGINQQQEIQLTVRSTPDFRKPANRPYTTDNYDRLILGYPNI